MSVSRVTSQFAAFAAALLLAGCASREPLEHLPESVMYVAVNSSAINAQEGAKKLNALSDKLGGSGASASSKKFSRLVVGISELGAKPGVYGVILGQPGFSDALLGDMRSGFKASDTKVDGKSAVSMPDGQLFVKLSDTATLLAGKQADVDTMMRTAQKKNPGAVGTPAYTKATALAVDHPVAVTLNLKPVFDLVGMQMAAVEKMDPKGFAALREAKTAALTLDWDKAPKAALSVYLDKEEDRQSLAKLANSALLMAKAQAATSKNMPAFLTSLVAKPDKDAVKLELEAPKEAADKVLAEVEAGTANLPQDPAARQKAIGQLVSKALMGVSGAAAPAAR